MKNIDHIKLFAFSGQLAENELRKLSLGSDLVEVSDSGVSSDHDMDYYPQFKNSLRKEATEMSFHYEIFYCLERSARELIAERLQETHGANWWSTAVPPNIQVNVSTNNQRELDQGITSRSTELIDYTTFGELGEIVRQNWTSFNDTFNNVKAFTRVMSNLNLLRGPIAHCCVLAEDEVLRLRLTLKDWFRLME
jgi:membrane-associated protease RseP (regulator of RpoE activity)